MLNMDMIRPCGGSWQFCNGECQNCLKVKDLSYANRTYSQDSETIANLLSRFEYHPEKREEILDKYNALLRG